MMIKQTVEWLNERAIQKKITCAKCQLLTNRWRGLLCVCDLILVGAKEERQTNETVIIIKVWHLVVCVCVRCERAVTIDVKWHMRFVEMKGNVGLHEHCRGFCCSLIHQPVSASQARIQRNFAVASFFSAVSRNGLCFECVHKTMLIHTASARVRSIHDAPTAEKEIFLRTLLRLRYEKECLHWARLTDARASIINYQFSEHFSITRCDVRSINFRLFAHVRSHFISFAISFIPCWAHDERERLTTNMFLLLFNWKIMVIYLYYCFLSFLIILVISECGEKFFSPLESDVTIRLCLFGALSLS